MCAYKVKACPIARNAEKPIKTGLKFGQGLRGGGLSALPDYFCFLCGVSMQAARKKKSSGAVGVGGVVVRFALVKWGFWRV